MSEIIKPSRRGFITGLASLIVAPAIVRVESIMPVKVIEQFTLDDYAKIINKNFDRHILYGVQFVQTEWIEYGFVKTLIDSSDIYIK